MSAVTTLEQLVGQDVEGWQVEIDGLDCPVVLKRVERRNIRGVSWLYAHYEPYTLPSGRKSCGYSGWGDGCNYRVKIVGGAA